MNEQDNFSINTLREESLSELYKTHTPYPHTQKSSNLFESLISTNIIDKSLFDLQPYRDSHNDFQAEEIDILRLEEMLPKLSIDKKTGSSLSEGRTKTTSKKEENFSISEKSDEDDSEYEAINRRKHKKPNRGVPGSTNNMLIILKSMIQSYLRRENCDRESQFLPKGYLNQKHLEWLITSSPIRGVLRQMLEERYLQRTVAASSISLQHKALYLKKLKRIMKWGASNLQT